MPSMHSSMEIMRSFLLEDLERYGGKTKGESCFRKTRGDVDHRLVTPSRWRRLVGNSPATRERRWRARESASGQVVAVEGGRGGQRPTGDDETNEEIGGTAFNRHWDGGRGGTSMRREGEDTLTEWFSGLCLRPIMKCSGSNPAIDTLRISSEKDQVIRSMKIVLSNLGSTRPYHLVRGSPRRSIARQ